MKEKIRKVPLGRPVTLSSPWGELAGAVGGSQILADMFGVNITTLTRWANQIHRPSELVKREVERLCKVYNIKNTLFN